MLGALLRLALVEAMPAGAAEWPWATFVANVLGALALGWLSTRLGERLPATTHLRPLLGTGLCGALTTFSTMQLELVRMLESGAAGLAFLYAAVSVLAGFAAVTLGTGLARRGRLT